MRMAAALALLLSAAALPAPAQRDVAAFSTLQPGAALPAYWETTTVARIKRHTDYRLVDDDGVTVLRAEADASMSGLLRRVDIDPAALPWLRWRWRVDTLVEQSSLAARDTDDFAARLYVMFDLDIDTLPFFERLKLRVARALYGGDLPLAALCYVWATKEPLGTSSWNAFTDRVRVIVVASGRDRLGQWTEFERNVADDYRAAFGGTPPHISAVAIASDSDNTGGRALAYYGDITVAAAPAPGRP